MEVDNRRWGMNDWAQGFELTPWMIGFLAMFAVFFLLVATFSMRSR